MNRSFIPCVLLAGNGGAAHEVRDAARRAGLTIALHPVDRRDDFLLELGTGRIDLILVPEAGLPGFPVAEILRRIDQSGLDVPTIVIGASAPLQNDVPVPRILRTGRIDELPAVMNRLLRERQGSRARVEIELDQAADMLRENQKLSTIGRLAASIAHEINNPLEAVTNLLYLIGLDERLSDNVQHYLELAQRELERVVRISKQTLNFYRETNAPVRVRLSDLLDEVLVLYGRKIADKNLRILHEYESTETVLVFPGEMRQVLSNLVTNAIEACSTNGKLCLRVRSTRKWSDSGVRGVRVSVGDNGTGIPAEARQRLGEPFFTTKGQYGTGLGLWVTRSIINRYGGELQLRSTTAPHRHGTVFSVFLPTNLRPQAVSAEADAENTGAGGSGPTGGTTSPRTRGTTRRRVSGD